MGHLKRGLLKKGEQVCIKTESYQVLRGAKVTRLLAILG